MPADKNAEVEAEEISQESIDHFIKTPFDEAFIEVAKRRGDIKVKNTKEASS